MKYSMGMEEMNTTTRNRIRNWRYMAYTHGLTHPATQMAAIMAIASATSTDEADLIDSIVGTEFWS